MIIRLLVACVIGLTVTASAQDIDAPPTVSHLQRISFWATSYWVHHAEIATSGIPLRDPQGKKLGPILAQEDWCLAALEGTVLVGSTTYNYAKSVKADRVDCSKYFQPDVGFSRFSKANGPFGDGTAGYILVPYRTIAADFTFLKPGTVLFIPAAIGQKLPDGTSHDGYFFVADTGGAIKNQHLDVFQGDVVVPFSFITSKQTHLFTGYVVTDPAIVSRLRSLHNPSGK